jgi:hypothetical protein
MLSDVALAAADSASQQQPALGVPVTGVQLMPSSRVLPAAAAVADGFQALPAFGMSPLPGIPLQAVPDTSGTAAVNGTAAGMTSERQQHKGTAAASTAAAAVLSSALSVLDATTRARLAAVLQLLTLQGVISWNEPPLPVPCAPPAVLGVLLQAAILQHSNAPLSQQEQQQQQGEGVLQYQQGQQHQQQMSQQHVQQHLLQEEQQQQQHVVHGQPGNIKHNL